MAVWELDQFKPPQFLGFVRRAYEATPQGFMGQRWLPNLTVDDLAFEYLLGANRRPAMATVLSYDSEAPLAGRSGQGERIGGELPPIKRKMRLGEKEIIRRYTNPRVGTADQQVALNGVYNDTLDLIESVQARIEWMALQTLSENVLLYDEDDIKWAFDYGVNGDFQWNIPTKLDNHSRWGNGATNQTITVGDPWNVPATATYINDLQKICDLIERTTGQRPVEFVCSRVVLDYMANSKEIKDLVRGTAAGTTTLMLSDPEIQSVFTRYRLPTIVPYDVTVMRELEDGSQVEVRPLAQNKAFLTQGRPIGNFLHGPTAESRILANTAYAQLASGIWANTYATDEPPAEWTKVAAVAFPTAPEMNRVGQMTLW